jgi:hypothetical protein
LPDIRELIAALDGLLDIEHLLSLLSFPFGAVQCTVIGRVRVGTPTTWL